MRTPPPLSTPRPHSGAPLGDGPVHRGFTVVEVVSALAVAMLVASVALPRLDPAQARVTAAAEAMVSVLTDAQRRSVRDGHDVVVRFDTSSQTSLVHFDVDGDGIVGPEERTELVGMADGIVFGRGRVTPMPQGDAVVTFSGGRGALPSVTFHRDGTASESGVVYLSTGGSMDEATVRAVEVARATGHSACHRFRSGGWVPEC